MSEKGFLYTRHFGFDKLPFENLPDPAFFYSGGGYARVFDHLTGCFEAGRGLMVVSGPMGSGKTTLSQQLMFAVPEDTTVLWMATPPENSDDFMLLLAQELGGEWRMSLGQSLLLKYITDCLITLHENGRRCLVIMDEAHTVCDEVLESVHCLNNLEHGAIKLIQMILLGQEELLEKLSRLEFAALYQCVATLEVIGRMEPGGIRDYILHRLEVAGCRSPVFTEAAIDAIAHSTSGIPRITNSLCDRALRSCFRDGKRFVDLDDVKAAARELGDPEVDRNLLFFLLERKNAASQDNIFDATQEEFLAHHLTFVMHRDEAPGDSTEEFDVTRIPVGAMPRTTPPATPPTPRTADSPERPVPTRSEASRRLGLPLLILLTSVGLFALSLWAYWTYTGFPTLFGNGSATVPVTQSGGVSDSRNREQVLARSRLEVLIAGFPCAHLEVRLDGENHLLLQGHVKPEDLQRLEWEIAAIPGPFKIISAVESLSWPYCEVVDLLAPFRADSGQPLDFGPARHTARYARGDLIVLKLTAPSYDAYLYVDYFQLDGRVIHMFPNTPEQRRRYRAGESLTIGEARDGEKQWQVQSPFGNEMIIILASRDPLFDTPRPETESAQDYLAALREMAPRFTRNQLVADHIFVTTASSLLIR